MAGERARELYHHIADSTHTVNSTESSKMQEFFSFEKLFFILLHALMRRGRTFRIFGVRNFRKLSNLSLSLTNTYSPSLFLNFLFFLLFSFPLLADRLSFSVDKFPAALLLFTSTRWKQPATCYVAGRERDSSLAV